MFDHFTILPDNVSLAHRCEQEYPDDPPDWIGYAGHTNTAVLQMIRHVAGARADGLLADEEA